MTAIESIPSALNAPAPDTLVRRILRSRRVIIGGSTLLLLVGACIVTLPWTLSQRSTLFFDNQNLAMARTPPDGGSPALWFGTDVLGRSLLANCLLGGCISLGIGIAAALLSTFLGVAVGLIAGYRGGWIDATLMRAVDVLYGLPYILMILLLKIALDRPLVRLFTAIAPESRPERIANLVVLLLAIGLVSWLTMARVVRGQVLSLRSQPFIEAARAAGLTERRIFLHHLLPNLVGPITVYATLIVPQAVLQESFLSFLGIGIQPPMPTWGSLASDGLLPALNPVVTRWWMLLFPCSLLAITLLCLNFVGDGLRDVFDPRRESAKI